MHCYRHTDTEAYVRCQRCERFICPRCQVEATVGFLCPEDAGQNATTRVVQNAPRSVRKFLGGPAPVTSILIGLCVLIWVLQMLPGSLLTIYGQYAAIYTPFEPWRMLTAGFLHSTSSIVPMHLALNMYSLYIFGRAIEPMLGSVKFFWLYVISLFGGSVGVLLLSDVTQPTVGASGAIFGLMGAYFVLAKSLGYNSNQFVSLIAINLVFGFIMPGIAWQAHVGGLGAGLLVGAAFVATRRATKAKQNLYLAAVAVGLIALTIITSTVRLAGVFLNN